MYPDIVLYSINESDSVPSCKSDNPALQDAGIELDSQDCG